AKTGIEFEATPVAAAAERAVRIDRNMAELAGRPRGARQHVTATDDGAPDAKVDRIEDEVPVSDRGAPGHLRDRGAIAFVVGKDRAIECRLEDRANIDPRPR